MVLGLLHGDADFERTLEITTRAGQDADCNASTAAGVLGALHGEVDDALGLLEVPRQVGQLRIRRKFEAIDVRCVLDERDALGSFAHRADHFRMPGVSDEDDVPPLLDQPLSLAVDLADQWAGGIEKIQPAAGRCRRN